MNKNNKKIDINVLKRLLKFVFENYKLHIVLTIISILVSSIISVLGSLLMKNIVDDYLTPLINQANPNFKPLINFLIVLSFVYIVGIIFNYIYQKVIIYITHGSINKLRNDVFNHMEKLPIKYFDTHPHGEIMSIYTNDIDTINNAIHQAIPQVFNSLITVISIFISMIVLNIYLTLFTILMLFLMSLAVKNLAKRSKKFFTDQQSNIAKENAYIEEMISGVKVVKVFTYEDKAINEFNKINEDLFNSSFNASKSTNIMMPIMVNLSNITYVLLSLFGGILAINNDFVTVGTIASFLTLNRALNGPIMHLSQQINSIITAIAGSNRVFNLLDEEKEIDNGTVTLVNVYEKDGILTETKDNTNIWAFKHYHNDGSTNLVKLLGDVKFNDVYFGYNEDKTILKNINLYAKPGEKIAFVGATGAGKTTIMNLLNRFYDIQQGSITYDGIDIKLIKKDDLRKSLGIVLQETSLFSGTIKENIKYSKPDASDEEIINAAKLANAHQFIKHLEHGYDTVLNGDGSPLSQGQKQLISIARAALFNPPVLILDEATSSIDSRTEKIVQDSMDKLMKGRTTFIIAHRLSTIKNSNVIMVMDKGEIVERGDHKSLLDKKGIYYQLYTGKIEID